MKSLNNIKSVINFLSYFKHAFVALLMVVPFVAFFAWGWHTATLESMRDMCLFCMACFSAIGVYFIGLTLYCYVEERRYMSKKR